ncbi:MAG: DUF4388 domain-containing protein, partial [Deltaproteobacteria bacterium]|nr:DUF4388 domain-containing protein [Deltaproteobacteria bacterium]
MARLQLLLVDPDLRAQRLTAAGLSRNGFTVTAVASGAEALERLRAHPVDGVLCAASLGGEGTSAVREVLRTLKEGPPFLLLVDGAGAGPSARWEGLAPLDVVSRPVALGDLVARIRAALDAAVRRRLEAGEEEAFQSSVDRMSLLDVVEFFRAQGRSGTVHFSGARDARLVFHAGAPVDAVAGIQSGKEAFFRLLSAREGTYVLRMAETSPEGNLGGGAEALLDEGIAYLEAWDHALEQVPPLSSVLEQDAVRVAEIQGALPEEAGWVLRLVDGERTVEDLVEASTLGGLAVLEILARLYFEGLVSVRKGAAAPTRRPLVDEWLNSPPSLPREPPEAASFRTVAAPAPAPAARTTQSLSREELAAFEEVPAAGEPLSTPGPETAGAPREELNAFAGMTPAEAPAPSARTTQGLSREELAAFADMPPAGAPPATPGTEAEAAPREDLNAFAGMLPAEAPSPSTGTAQGRSREAPSAFAEVTPAAEAPREALGAFAGMTPGPVAAQPQGFVDDGGFPMGSSSAVADPTPFALARGAPPEPVPSGSEGAFPLHFARAPAGAEEPPRPAEGTRETARGELLYDAQPPPPDVPAEPPVAAPEPPREEPLPDTVPPVATGVQEPSPAPSQPAASSQGDDEEFIPVKRNWGFAAVAVGGVLLVGLGAYFGTRTSANTKEPVPPVAVAPPLAAEPVAEQVPEQVPEPDAGGLAAVEPASPDAG